MYFSLNKNDEFKNSTSSMSGDIYNKSFGRRESDRQKNIDQSSLKGIAKNIRKLTCEMEY